MGSFVVLHAQVVVFGEGFAKQLPGEQSKERRSPRHQIFAPKKERPPQKNTTRQHRHTLYEEEEEEKRRSHLLRFPARGGGEEEEGRGGGGREGEGGEEEGEEENSGQGPGAIRSPLMGESFSAKAISSSVADPPGRPDRLGVRNLSRRARRPETSGRRAGMVMVMMVVMMVVLRTKERQNLDRSHGVPQESMQFAFCGRSSKNGKEQPARERVS
ncbi:hypothetical protein V3481_014911 [Fusarium oxysporum f. sp. vasinfectum]